MKTINLTIVGVMSLAMGISAADYSMTNNNAYGISSFNSGADWEHGEAPAAGNNYFIAGKSMRTPNDSVSTNHYVFAGDRLTVNGGTFGWKTRGNITVDDYQFIDFG
ncbi:MAG: hypothetical protein PF904_19240 [Kiritimatiellae bacterium]|nr:hypothetical protein [Kiritimatiellia bacterium]